MSDVQANLSQNTPSVGTLPPWINAVVVFIKEVGFPIAVAVYFFVKDWYFTSQQVALETRIATVLEKIVPLLQLLQNQ